MTMNKLLTETPIMALVIFLCLIVVSYTQNKSSEVIKQEKFLAEIPFDRVILYALIAAEHNYKFRERIIPRIHVDDYYALILNTAKRLAMADSSRITLPGFQEATQTDSTKNKEK